MKKILSYLCGICATAFIASTIITVSSCSQDDDYYESDMYTMAEPLETRAAEPGAEPTYEWWIHEGSINMKATVAQHHITFQVSWPEQSLIDGLQTAVNKTIRNNSSSLPYTDELGIERTVKRYKQTKELDAHIDFNNNRLVINGVFYFAKAIENPKVTGAYGQEQMEFLTAEGDIPEKLLFTKVR